MTLFLDDESYQVVSNKYTEPYPESKLLNHAYLMYYLHDILCEEEKSKLYEFFIESTDNSKKKIKRLQMNDQESVDNIQPRLVNRMNKSILHRDQKIYTFNRILPTIEIIQWPNNEIFTETFNSITRNRYIPKNKDTVYGTYIIPLTNTSCSTLFREFGLDGINVIKCNCTEKCIHETKCLCKPTCCCDEPVRVKLTENKNGFYLSDIEPVDILGMTRINLYVHLEYKSNKKA